MNKLLGACLTVSLLAGCFNTRISLLDPDESTERVSMSALKGANLDHFIEFQNTACLFWGIVAPDAVDPKKVLAPYLQGGTRVSNLKISTYGSFTDSLVAVLSLGIYCPMTIQIEGDVVGTRPQRRK